MSQVMLVNRTHVEESRVVVLEDGTLAAYEIETLSRTHIRGNIHNAVVESVHPSLEAAFVRIGPDLKGFLPLDEVNFRLLPARSDSRKNGKIGQHLHPGQKIMAQVVREPFGEKPPSVSTYFSLPGRYLVLMPGVDSGGVSRKISDTSQRERLKKIADELSAPEGFGLIVRTAGLGQTKTELQRDLRYLLRLWESIQRASAATEFPALVYREADLVIRTIRDHWTPNISEVWIDNEEAYEKALAFVRDVMPSRAKTIRMYTGDRPLFNKFNLEEQIERIYKRKVPLPSGGEIVIDGTEALTAIDVNSARSRRQADLEDIALQTNVEAAAEIARQLRLRDLGGLVVIDFIDMSVTRNKAKVEKAMRDAMRGDKARYDVTRISKLGLVEIARQRLKGAKMAASYATCTVCDGYGLVKNIEAAGLAAFRKLQTRTSRGGMGRVRVGLPPEVATWVQNHKREELLRIEQRHGLRIEIEPTPKLRRHENEFETFARERGEQAAVAAAGATPPARPPEPAAAEAGRGAPASPKPKPKPKPKQEKVVPFRPPEEGKRTDEAPLDPPATKPTGAVTGDETGAEEAANGRGRRRRRRRRRRPGPPVAADGAETPPTAAPDNAPAKPAEAPVPRDVRADELMPAAVGGAERGARKKGRSPGSAGRRRRPRGSGTKGKRSSGEDG